MWDLRDAPEDHAAPGKEPGVTKAMISKKGITCTHGRHRLVQPLVLGCVVYKFLVAGLSVSSLGRRNFRLRKRRERPQLDQERMAELNSVTTLFQLRMLHSL